MIRTVGLALLLLSALSCAHQRFEQPTPIRFGATVAETDRALSGLCGSQRTRRVDPPFLPNVQTQQLQTDCDGFQFFGRPRHVEFVFRDDRLVMVWLMVDPQETERFIAALSDAYGTSTHRNQNYIAFEQVRVAWRFHPAEILFYSQELDADMAPDFR